MREGEFPFIGRKKELEAFHSLLSLREQKSALYVEAMGGLGKTRYLRRIIEKYKQQPRWYFAPAGSTIDPLIDFFELSNRSVAGLRRSIVERLGKNYFQDFITSEAKLRDAEKEANSPSSSSIVFALQRQTDELFFKNFKNAISEIRKYVVLVFDTFEVARHRQVGRWFLNEFLLRQETTGCFVVFAGRSPQLSLPVRVRAISLPPWSEKEVQEYLDQHFEGTSFEQEEITQIYAATEGHPLLVDMLVYVRNSNLAPLDELKDISREQLEFALINRIVQSHNIPEHSVLLEMGYLHRRFEPRIFALRQQGTPAYRRVKTFDELVHTLLNDPSPAKQGFSSMIKYRSTDQVLTLHDEVQRMITQHAFSRAWNNPALRNEWKALVQELYDDVVVGWYPEAIKQARTEEERGVLVAEQLGYELDQKVDLGIALYKRCFEDAWKRNRFSFIELLWGEIADRLEEDWLTSQEDQKKLAQLEYELCYLMADWLWTTNQFDAAVDLYLMLVERYTNGYRNTIRKLDAFASLGHALMRTGKFEEARTFFDQGLSLAEEIQNKHWVSAFQQNIGQVLQLANQWKEAETWFVNALKSAETGGTKESRALACVQLGRLQALRGDYDEAILNCQKAVALRHAVLLNGDEGENNQDFDEPLTTPFGGYYSPHGRQTRLATAHLRLADAYRYAGSQNRSKARSHYEKALAILDETNGYRFLSEALQGLGNVYHDQGVDTLRSGNYKDAVKNLGQAFESLDKAIGLCREYQLEQLLPQALHRLAHIFEAIGELNSAKNDPQTISLLEQVNRFILPEEDAYRERLNKAGTFDKLDIFAKAQRIFEVSWHEAERIRDYNTGLDSLVQAANIALRRGCYEDVRKYNRHALPSPAFQEHLFEKLLDLTLADLDLAESNFPIALKRYQENIPIIARGGGYGRHLIQDQLNKLSRKLQAMPRAQALQWCEKLIQSWENDGLAETHPYLIARMWEYWNSLSEQPAEL